MLASREWGAGRREKGERDMSTTVVTTADDCIASSYRTMLIGCILIFLCVAGCLVPYSILFYSALLCAQLLSELSSVNKLSALYRPSVITLNFGSFSQDQFDSSLDLLHQMQYMTCVATKRKGGQYLHAFHQPALLKLKGVQFI